MPTCIDIEMLFGFMSVYYLFIVVESIIAYVNEIYKDKVTGDKECKYFSKEKSC